ncbi:MAG: hypothetical protein V7782_02035 [Psychromonas sp.]
MLNKHLKLMMLISLALVVSGCGGSDGGDAADNGNDLEEDSSDAYTIEAEIATVAKFAIEDLVADEDFLFIEKSNIQVLLELPGEEQRAYVSVYSKYQLLESENYYPDPASRIIAGALKDGNFEESFVALNNQQQYLIEVWFYDGSEPLQQALLVNQNSLIW